MEFNRTPTDTPPDNNLVWAILATVLCCLPLGVVSIIKATKVRELWALGDVEGAQKAADDAKKWAIWSALVLIIGVVLYFIIALAFIGISNGF